ncbi:hypothetical protein [Microbacterium gilvum]|uniref:Uncharacterized protein n=1 Tax=Microbacterium gilvum TaxID=1336204 RepID=A0ABP8ZUC8_9MICO
MTNTATVLAIPLDEPPLGLSWARLERAGAALWRVRSAADGRSIGHLRVVKADGAVRYRAERFHAACGALIAFGEFWTADEAVDVLRRSV